MMHCHSSIMGIVCKVAKLIVALYAINGGVAAVFDNDIIMTYMTNAKYGIDVVAGIAGVVVLVGLVMHVVGMCCSGQCEQR